MIHVVRRLGAIAAGLALSVGVGSAAPVIEVTRVTPSGVSFRYVPPPAELIPAGEGTPELRTVLVPEADQGGSHPGAWRVPVHTAQVLLPEGADWSLDYRVAPGDALAGIVFPRVPTGDPAGGGGRPDPGRDTVPAAWPADDGVTPGAPVSGVVEIFRGRRLLLVTLAPLQFDPLDGSARLFASIDVDVRFRPSTSAARDDPAAASMVEPSDAGVWAGLVLNPDVGGDPWHHGPGRMPTATREAGNGLPDVYFGDAPIWLKLGVTTNGIHRITAGALVGAAVDPATIDPETIRLFAGPGTELNEATDERDVPGWGEPGGFREVAIAVREAGTPDRRFDAADTLLFYGLAVDNFGTAFDPAGDDAWLEHEDTGANVYWMTWGGTFPEPPRRMAVEAAVPAGTTITTVRDRRHVEINDPSLYDPVPREVGVRWEKWWWQRIEDSGASYFWDVPLPDVDTDEPLDVSIRWWGSNTPAFHDLEPTQRHFLRVSVNDEPDVDAIWGGGIARYDQDLADLPARDVNRIVARVTEFPGIPLRIDQILLAWMELTWWKRLNLAEGQLAFPGSSSGPGPVTFEVAGSAPGARAFDVTEPWDVHIVPAARTMEGSVPLLRFGAAMPAGRRYALANPAGYLAPVSMARDERPGRWLREIDPGADYLVITADEFESSARDLATWRRTHLRGITDGSGGTRADEARTQVVRVSDIYDEFSGGLPDVTAIRNFLSYAFRAWNPGPGGRRLQYVCLLGDANRDTRDRQGTGEKNLVPTWQGGYDPAGGSGGSPAYATDDFLARFDGPTDRLTDLALGRLPVSDVASALVVVRDKVIGAERVSRLNPDRNRAILVSDDVCQAGRGDGITHTAQNERIDRSIPAAFDRLKIYLYDYGENDCSILSKPAAKRDLIEAINDGSWLVNYVGHGGDQVLADERVLETTDVSSLTNADALTVLLAASCSVGKFDRPGSDGLAEALIKWPTGGCHATIAATYLTYAGENEQLNIQIFRTLFPRGDNRSTTLGAALLRAKIRQTAARTCTPGFDPEFCDQSRRYLLFGDPAAVIATADRQIRITDHADTLERGTVVTVRGEVLRPDSTLDTGWTGEVDLVVQDQPEMRVTLAPSAGGGGGNQAYALPGATIYQGRWMVTAGRFEATFVVPVSVRGGGGGRLRAFAYAGEAEAVGVVSRLAIGGLAAGAPVDTTAPTIDIKLPGGRLTAGQTLSIGIEDENGINRTRLFEFRSILLSFLDNSGEERFRADVTDEFQYDAGSYQRGAVTTRVPDLPAGNYTIRLTATDNFNNRGEARRLVVVGPGGTVASVSGLIALPNPFRVAATILFDLAAATRTVRVTIYSVAGRKVRDYEMAGVAGENRLQWDGADARGDQVANGVYLVRVAARPDDGGDDVDLVEPIVRRQ